MQNYVLNTSVSPQIQPNMALEMPQGAQLGLEIIAGLIMLWTIYYFIVQAKKTNSAFPIFFGLGALPLMFIEPLLDITMGCFYPHVGQNTAFELYGRKMPWFLVFCYLGGIAPVMYAAGRKMAEGVTSGFIWKLFFLMGAGTAIYELITINLGLWTYYGAHPFKLFNYPIEVGFTNGVAFVLTALTVAKLEPVLKGKLQYMAILILPIVFAAGEFASGWPIYSVIHTAASLEYPVISYLGFLAMIGMTGIIIWWVNVFIATDKVSYRQQLFNA